MTVDIHVTYMGHYDSNLAVHYVTFGSEHRKLVGNPVRLHDVVPLLQWGEIFAWKPMKIRFQQYLVRTEILLTFHTQV